MAPEQLEGKEADARSDIFARPVLYEMVTGKRVRREDVDNRCAILAADPPPISSGSHCPRRRWKAR
jgi:hypothetical protein